MKFKVVLVRHGYSLGNKNKLLSGWTDVPLTHEGIEELNTFKEIYEYPETDYYFSSDLSRAFDTARIIYPDKEIKKLSDFREMNFGIYENKGKEDLDLRAFFTSWFKGDKIEGGENYNQFSKRIITSFNQLNKKILEKDKNSYTLVSHSGTIRLIYQHCLKLNVEDFFKIEAPNGLGYEFEFNYKSGALEFSDVSPIGDYTDEKVLSF